MPLKPIILLNGWLILLSLTVSLPVNAALWSVQPSVSTSGRYDDNRSMSVDDKESAWSGTLSPTVRFSVAEQDKGLSGSASARFRRFFSDSDTQRNDDSNDVSLLFGVNSYLNTERSTYGFNFNLTRRKTSDTQGSAVDADSIDQDATRITTNFGPNWSWSFNEKTSISANYSHSTLRYTDKLPNSTLVESDTDVVSTTLSRNISETMAVTLNASYSNFRPSTDLDSETVSLTAGLTGDFNETISGNFSVGQRKTKFDTRTQGLTGFCIGADPGSGFPECTGGFPVVTGTRNIDDEDDNTGLTFNARFTKRLESGSLGLSASRIVTPITTRSTESDSGVLNTTLISVFGNHSHTERLSSRLNVSLVDREDITSGSSADSRKFISYSAGLSWRWHPDLQLSATYIHRQNEIADSSDTARGNSINFALNYSLPRLNTSR